MEAYFHSESRHVICVASFFQTCQRLGSEEFSIQCENQCPDLQTHRVLGKFSFTSCTAHTVKTQHSCPYCLVIF